MFTYSIVMECKIAGRDFEFHKEWHTPTQLREGDQLHIDDDLEGVRIKEVVWYLGDAGKAFVDVESQDLAGNPHDWACLLEVFDYSVPDIRQCSPT